MPLSSRIPAFSGRFTKEWARGIQQVYGVTPGGGIRTIRTGCTTIIPNGRVIIPSGATTVIGTTTTVGTTVTGGSTTGRIGSSSTIPGGASTAIGTTSTIGTTVTGGSTTGTIGSSSIIPAGPNIMRSLTGPAILVTTWNLTGPAIPVT